ncbi:MAG: SpoIIE family protein phosphatase [Planctomycetes bacterium]|nr:SpoIIE family protein phosphatase [Planctomycetota bacterium]
MPSPATESIYNVLLCVEFEEDVLAHYKDMLGTARDTDARLVVSKSGKIFARRFEIALPTGETVKYNLIMAMGGKDAVEIAADLHEQGDEIVVGFFELRETEEGTGHAGAIQEIRKHFPKITCGVVAPYSEAHFRRIADLFGSPDEWLYFDGNLITRPELEHTIGNLIASFRHTREREEALERVEAGRQGMHQILAGSPDLLKMQNLDELYGTIVRQAAALAGSGGALLALKNDEGFKWAAGCGRFDCDEDSKIQLRRSQAEAYFQRALEEGKRQEFPYGTVIPMTIQGKKIGVLYLDEAAQALRDAQILDVFASQAAFAVENSRLRLEIDAKKAIEHELDLAARIQRSLVPSTFPDFPGMSVYGLMQSAKEIGGDYYDCIVRDHDGQPELVLAVGDVAGKGVPAGLIMTEVRSFIRSQVRITPNLKEILVSVAALVKDDLLASPGKFLSLLLSRWRSGEDHMKFCSAGHEHILHWRADKKNTKAHRSGGVVMGVPIAALEKAITVKGLRYAPGDVVLFFTDGVTEALNPQGEMFKLERLVALLDETAELPVRDMVETILSGLGEWMAGAYQRDDITLLAVKIEG